LIARILNPLFFILKTKTKEKRKMPEEAEADFMTALLSEFNTKIRDLEEKQRLLKERVLLIGQNLIESRENLEKEVTELKLSVGEMKQDTEKVKHAILRLSEDLDRRARKNEVELLAKQMKMFQPLELVTMDDVKKLLKKK
jgi:hypothetical protein